MTSLLLGKSPHLDVVSAAELARLDQWEAERRAEYAALDAVENVEDLVGVQVPTFMWVPPYEDSLGPQAAKLYEEATRPIGGRLDPWQRLSLEVALAFDARQVRVCFEFALILSRQNGKGEVLLALELAWLFLFGEKLVVHSAHLFETSREHFLKVQQVIELNPDFERRVFKLKEGRGSEEIILKARPSVIEGRAPRTREVGGARLKFMTRKGGAGRGFTGGKLVLDEAMYLDALMMAAGLPTMATRSREAQVVYAGSAGMRHSTQLANVRDRGRRPSRGLPGERRLGLLEWVAERPVYDEATGKRIGGDDPADPRTWAKTNPALAGEDTRGRITVEYVVDESGAMGGTDSPTFWMERLGIGDWPVDSERWEVVDKAAWAAVNDQASVMLPDGRVLGVDADEDTGVYALSVSGLREDGLAHLETVERRKGSAWIVERVLEIFEEKGWRYPVVLLKTGEAGHVAGDLEKAEVVVHTLTDTEYAQACAALVQETNARLLRHIGQRSLTGPMGSASKRLNAEGGWRWNRESPAQAPLVAVTLARAGVRLGFATVEDRIGDVW